MIDGSHLPYEENVALTKKVVEYAHQFDVTVEGELGVLAGVEDEVSADHHTYTDPEEVIDFATRTGCDSLAISIGTSHGAYKFTPEQCHIDPKTGRMVPPPLAFEVLDAVMEKLPGFPIVLHGSSSVPEEEVETINKYGGALKAAIGIPEEELRKAAKSAVCKINIDSDSRLAMTAAVRKVFAEKPAEFDPYVEIQLGRVLSIFQMRYRAYMNGSKIFPHEMGLLLGYPVEDVTGFMVHGGKNSLYSGYWKVYADVAKKLEIFKRFEMAKEMLIRLVSSGVSMEEIIGYYNENILQTAVV